MTFFKFLNKYEMSLNISVTAIVNISVSKDPSGGFYFLSLLLVIKKHDIFKILSS